MKLPLAALLFALAPFAAKALDLTPTISSRDLEGVQIPILLFTDAGKKISFQPPVKWHVSGGGGGVLSLYPPELPDAVMQLVFRPRKPLDPGATEDLEKWCLAQLPQDATGPARDGEAAGVFSLGTLPSREFTFSYAAQGRRFTTSVAFVDWNERERLAVIVTARTADYRPIHEAAMRSMFSWNPR